MSCLKNSLLKLECEEKSQNIFYMLDYYILHKFGIYCLKLCNSLTDQILIRK